MPFAETLGNGTLPEWGMLVGAAGVIAFLFRALISAKDEARQLERKDYERLIAELQTERKNYRDFVAESLKTALDAANWNRVRDGKTPIHPEATVLPLHQSPATQKQREVAEFGSQRQLLSRLKSELHFPPQPPPEIAIEPIRPGPPPLIVNGLDKPPPERS